MRLVKKVIKLIFLLSLLVFVSLTLYKFPYPEPSQVVDSIKVNDPKQEKITQAQVNLYAGELSYEIQPKYSYDLWGLVVSQHDSGSFLDIYHKKDPANTHDICVVWGKNIDNESYKKVKFSSGDFVCYYKWRAGENPGISGLYLANNHLVPANPELAKIISQTNIGDQIHLKGFLSEYKIYDKTGYLKLSRGTSIARDDTGNGACETIYVTDYEIVRKSNAALANQIRKYSLYSLTVTAILGMVLFMFYDEKKSG
ncbi:MAG: hypothetical protein UT61_C0012G0002 [Candidatus Woesebacteria bacterium GW2011_GWA1_39_8]|uniref:Uncharacterized protein n=1 Tax=Candidatus Woesebacteria bacterium GW2011_GWA1_39_8 TaxID=1618552 RepID=A0A0G0SX30_9BACT|nr:MAG: hypothetical protein UT61_C0012G0002 [Candidatus Woesebacteria bacterium GW2011_GWA1_39_8]